MAHELPVRVPLYRGAQMRALLVIPEGEKPPGGWPAVIAIHDIAGFTPDIRRIARRFADHGYAALAPALYDGAGAPVLCVVRTLLDHQRREGRAFDRLEAANSFLADRLDVDASRIGVTGFCLGGGFALFFAARGGVRVCAPYYGDTAERAEELRQVCPVVAGFGETDRSYAAKGRRLEAHLKQLGIPHDVKIYPGVGHSYMNDHGPGAFSTLGRLSPLRAAYDESAAEDSWERMLRFFAEHL